MKNNNIILYFAILLLLLYICRIGVVENYEEKESTTLTISEGGSEKYGWGYENTDVEKEKEVDTSDEIIIVDESITQERRCPSCENTYADKKDLCVLCKGGNKDCRFADITKNVDIDKYVLKSSIPPCPDLSEYAKKNQVPPNPFNEEWIRKSEIPACPEMPNMEEWIRKSEVPNCSNMECPKCPVCPLAPSCPQTNVSERSHNGRLDKRLERSTLYKGLSEYEEKQQDIQKYSKNLNSSHGGWESNFDELNNGYTDIL